MNDISPTKEPVTTNPDRIDERYWQLLRLSHPHQSCS